MLLSGIFFVSLHHQSNRMTMFKKTDPNPQLDIFTAPSMQLGSRASKKYSDPNAWHNQFYSLVTTKIDEEIFKPLFPEGKKSGRPNASIRILVAMSVLKEGFGCSDEDLFEKCEFDLLTRKAQNHISVYLQGCGLEPFLMRFCLYFLFILIFLGVLRW